MTEEQARFLKALRELVLLHLSEEEEERALKLALCRLEAGRRNGDPEVERDAEAIFETLLLVGDIHKRMHSDSEAIAIYSDALAMLSEGLVTVDAVTNYEVRQKLGTLLDNRNESEAALPLLRDALEILETIEGASEESIANLCNNLGMISKGRNDFTEAENYYLKALSTLEGLRGDDHLSVAAILNNLGALYWAWEELEKARDYHLRALEIRTTQLPETHPDLGQSASNLAAVYHTLGEFGNASHHYERAVKILEKNVETDAETYEIVVQNYADLLKDHDKGPKGTRLLNQCKKLLAKNGVKTVA